jgi:hypothetical protein
VAPASILLQTPSKFINLKGDEKTQRKPAVNAV